MNYTIHQLEIFKKVCDLKSITKASEALFLTQPAVSIQLKKFQEQFEIPLFEIISRKIHITDFGLEVVASAERILSEIEDLSSQSLAYKGLTIGKLKIMSVSTGKYVIPYLLSDFINQHQGIDLKLDVTNKLEVVKALEKNEIDFALISIMPDALNLEYEELLDNHLYLVGNNHFYNLHSNAKKSFLNTAPLIFREKGSATRYSMEQFLSQNGINNKVKIELTSNEAVKQSVMAGLGVSIMPEIGIKSELKEKDLHILPVRNLPIVTQWRLVWLKGKKISPVAQAFLSYIRENKEGLINKIL